MPVSHLLNTVSIALTTSLVACVTLLNIPFSLGINDGILLSSSHEDDNLVIGAFVDGAVVVLVCVFVVTFGEIICFAYSSALSSGIP